MCRKQGLSLRQVSIKAGLSHTTIAQIVNGSRASADSVIKLARAFDAGDEHHRGALEDELLTFAGYRTRRPEEGELNEPVAGLLDKLSGFNETQLKIMGRFADFISEMETKR